MAYFLKKNKKKDKVYLSIVNSFYDHQRGFAVHETYASYGTGKSLIEKGIEDPIAYLEDKVKQLNNEKNSFDEKLISDVAPYKHAGHFLLKAVLNKLQVEPILNAYDLTRNSPIRLFDLLSALIYARCIKPCSEYETYFEIFPYLEKEYSFSSNQLVEALSYFGQNYEKIVEIFTTRTQENYTTKTDVRYFYDTNFYYEIEQKDTLICMGLLLDKNLIPIDLKLSSEDLNVRNVIKDDKNQNNSSKKIVHVDNKGLNYTNKIYEAKLHNDGYIFSKPINSLTETEKSWLLQNNDYEDVYDQNQNLLYRTKECIDTFTYTFKGENNKLVTFQVKEKRIVTYNPSQLCPLQAKKDVDFEDKDGLQGKPSINEDDEKLCGYSLIVTSELNLDKKEIYQIYHNLSKIDKSFSMLKDELEARPNKNTIYGHFLISYLSTLLISLVKIHELKDEKSYEEIFKFISELKYVIVGNKYINMITNQPLLDELSTMTKLPLKNAMLTKNEYEKIMSYKL